MNPLWFIVKVGGIALITAAGARFVVKELVAKSSNLVAGTIHFRKAMNEFRKGLQTMVFGPPEATTPETTAARKRSGRIQIE